MIPGSFATALVICVVAAALEGVCAGTGVTAVFARLNRPRLSPPMAVWFVIGGMYYLTFGFVLYRLLVLPATALRDGAIVLVVVMMAANALWNLLFFRARNFYAAFLAGAAAPLPDLALLICLWRQDVTAAATLVPYLIYRIYAVWWGYALWKANR